MKLEINSTEQWFLIAALGLLMSEEGGKVLVKLVGATDREDLDWEKIEKDLEGLVKKLEECRG